MDENFLTCPLTDGILGVFEDDCMRYEIENLSFLDLKKPYSGEHRPLAAILDRAVRDLYSSHPYERKSAHEWFTDRLEDCHDRITFSFVCEALDLDAARAWGIIKTRGGYADRAGELGGFTGLDESPRP